MLTRKASHTVEWEVFVPENYAVRAIDGNVITRASAVPVSRVAETVTVSGDKPAVDRASAQRDNEAQKQVEPSQNVINLQRRAAGVLPVRVEVPRAGTSHQFVKPLVVDQEAVVNFRYKRR